ncbi:hypothetical protein D9757_011659 [Collybiopsis confluens]|uniref:Uncharacterized protein n=1 Tax=Collybiopsis confluens TaxID=2823264 RepID=A0A8H5GHV9_9AGAR|nr:hypothetical protein D9757_011659 [Collybiopsis confluens]
MGFSAVALPVKSVIPPCPYLGSEGGCLYALPVNVVIPSPCSIHILGTKPAVHANPPSAPLQQPSLWLNTWQGPRWKGLICLSLTRPESSIRTPATALLVNAVITSPCSTHILGMKLAVHAIPPSAPPQPPPVNVVIHSSAAAPPSKCCHPLSIFHPDLGNKADCPYGSSVSSSSAALLPTDGHPAYYLLH